MRISDWSSDVCSSDLNAATSRIDRRQHLVDAREFLSRAAVARPCDFGGVDLLPVLKGHDLQPTRGDQPVKARPPFRCTRRRIGRAQFGDSEPVGPVGADRPGRPAPCPAHAITPGRDAPLLVYKPPDPVVKETPGYLLGPLSYARDHHSLRHHALLPPSAGQSTIYHPR